MESQDNRKPFGLKRIGNSIKNSIAGFKAAYSNEQSMWLQLIATIILIALSIIYNISWIEWLFVIMIIGLTCAAELFNTALENMIDLTVKHQHPLAKIAKDTSSAAEFILCIMSFIMVLIIFIPKILA